MNLSDGIVGNPDDFNLGVTDGSADAKAIAFFREGFCFSQNFIGADGDDRNSFCGAIGSMNLGCTREHEGKLLDNGRTYRRTRRDDPPQGRQLDLSLLSIFSKSV